MIENRRVYVALMKAGREAIREIRGWARSSTAPELESKLRGKA
jgi:hypothetical protein